MKRMLSMVLVLLMLAVPLFTVAAGANGSLLEIPVLGLYLAVPEDAVVMSEEEMAASNADPFSPWEPVGLFGMTIPEHGINFGIGERQYDEDEDFHTYCIGYAASLLLMGGDPDDLESADADFVGLYAVEVAHVVEGYGILSYLIPIGESGEVGVYVVTVFAPLASFEDGSAHAILNNLFVPM